MKILQIFENKLRYKNYSENTINTNLSNFNYGQIRKRLFIKNTN